MRRLKCKGCDTMFVALRSDAVTCSAKCRQRYKRQCDKITRIMSTIKSTNAPHLAAFITKEKQS